MAIPRPKKISLVLQKVALGRAFPDSESGIRNSELVWRGCLIPTPMSRHYRVELRYKWTGIPEVRLIEPELEFRGGKEPPHLYKGNILCLHLPGEWNGSMLLAETILPWTAEWLLHYEIWLATGEWEGGGAHPPAPKTPGRTDRGLT